MNRWTGPLALGLLAGVVGWYATLAATPAFIMGRALDRLTAQAGVNRMTHAPLVTAQRQTIVRPSPDLGYSICVIDLLHGPVKVHADPVPGHYWSLTVFDGETNVAFVESDRDSQGAPVDIVLATSAQKLPGDVRKIILPSTTGAALLRVLLNGRAEFNAVTQYRKRSYCRPMADTGPVSQARLDR